MKTKEIKNFRDPRGVSIYIYIYIRKGKTNETVSNLYI